MTTHDDLRIMLGQVAENQNAIRQEINGLRTQVQLNSLAIAEMKGRALSLVALGAILIGAAATAVFEYIVGFFSR